MTETNRRPKRRFERTMPAENDAFEEATLLSNSTESTAILQSSDDHLIVVDTLFLAQYSDFFKCAFYGPNNDYVERRRRQIRLGSIPFEPLAATLKILRKLAIGHGADLFHLPHGCCTRTFDSAFSKRRKMATTTTNSAQNDSNNNNNALAICTSKSSWLAKALSSACSLGSKHCFDEIELPTALDILDVAAYLQLEIVLKKISELICKLVSTSTLLPTYRKAELRYRPLANRLWRTIVEDFRVLVIEENFVELHADELITLLRDPKLNLHPIDEYPVVSKWLEANFSDFDYQNKKDVMKLRLATDKYLAHTRAQARSSYTAESAMGSVMLTSSANKNSNALPAVLTDGIASTTTPFVPQMGIGFYDRPRIPQTLLVAVGGWATGGPTNQIEFYEPNRQKWLAVQGASHLACPQRRAYHALVSAVDNFSPSPASGDYVSVGAANSRCLYMVGGYDGVRHHKSIHKLNLDTLKWSEVAPMNEQRCYVSSTTIDENRIIAVGGFNEDNRLRSAEVFDIERNQWSMVSMMNSIRSDADCTTIDGLVYVVGGFNGTVCHNNCEVYDSMLDTWTTIRRPMRHRRSGVKTVCMVDRVLMVVGGFTGSVRLKTPEFYDPREGTWHLLADMNNKRSNFGIETLDNRITVCGGYNNVSTTNLCESYDFRANRWQTMTEMSFSRSALAVCRIDRHPLIEDIVQEFDHGANLSLFV